MPLAARLRRIVNLLADPRTPKLPKAAVVFAVLYLLFPFDALWEWVVPVVGWLDDLVVLWLALRWLVKRAPADEPSPVPARNVQGR